MNIDAILEANPNLTLVKTRPFSEDDWTVVSMQGPSPRHFEGPVRVNVNLRSPQMFFDGEIAHFKDHSNENLVILAELRSLDNVLRNEQEDRFAMARAELDMELQQEEMAIHGETQIVLTALTRAWIDAWMDENTRW